MKLPKCSVDGKCPSCSGSEWKLAKMLVLAGSTRVDTRSKGGGYGVGVASGQGLEVNYQGLELSTTGTYVDAMAAEYSPPPIPDGYSNKEYWVKECSTNLDKSSGVVDKAEDFAFNAQRIKPGLFDGFRANTALSVYKANFDKAYSKLLNFQEYEEKKSVWDVTRVCDRCGEAFTFFESNKEIQYSFKLPKYSFKGINSNCPSCKSYEWKAAELYYNIPVRELENDIKYKEKSLEDSIKYYSEPPKKGLLSWINKPFFKPVDPDLIRSDIVTTETQLAKAIEKRNEFLEKNGSFIKLRVCLSCNDVYSLS